MIRDFSLKKELEFQVENMILVASKLYSNEEPKIEAIVCDIIRDVVQKGNIDALKLIATNVPESDPLKYVIEALVGHAEKLLKLRNANRDNDTIKPQFNDLLKVVLFNNYPTARYLAVL
jgi:hypothetical protein